MATLTNFLEMPDGKKFEFYGRNYYGVCDSVANAENKGVKVLGLVNENNGRIVDPISAGTRIIIKFTYGVTKISGLNIVGYGLRYVRVLEGHMNWMVFPPGQVLEFIYDGNAFYLLTPSLESNIWRGRCSTDNNTIEKTVRLTDYGLITFDASYLQDDRTLVVVDFMYAGDPSSIPSVITMNVENTGAFPMLSSRESATQCTHLKRFPAGLALCRLVSLSRYTTGYDHGWLVLTNPLIRTSSTGGNIDHNSVPSTALMQSYVNDAKPTKVSSLTNDAGYLTLSTLPIYDGTVE